MKEHAVRKRKRHRSARVKFPLIVSEGPKVDVTNEQIYEQAEFPSAIGYGTRPSSKGLGAPGAILRQKRS